MSLWTRVGNVFRGDRLSREIREEMETHFAAAVAEGRDPAEVRRAFGSPVRLAEESRDFRLLPWLDSLRADAVFGWRQLRKRKVTSAAAILSLALGIGACTAAFRLIDAVLLRPLPVASPERLFVLSREVFVEGKWQGYDDWAYPDFRLMRAAVKGDAELIAVSHANSTDITFKSEQEMEKARVQYVSAWMFGTFGLQPAAGRLLTENDDLKPGAHPYAVLSYDYWKRRFALDRNVVGRTFRMGDELYQIAGVGPAPFTGTETGIVTDIFVPSMMHPGAVHDDWTWHRSLAVMQPGVVREPVRARLDATSRAFERERSKGFKDMRQEDIERFINQRVVMSHAASGASELQTDYRVSLVALGVLVVLVLLIACANVANLMAAQSAARAREMALRVSIGAGRVRLVQLVLMESALLALLAGALGALLAWWAAPFTVGMINPADNPVRLALPADWRVSGFGMALTFVVMLLFGLVPALRASAVKPAHALKGGDDPHTRRRLMHVLVAAQVAFCFLVLFVAGLFAVTFERLSHRPLGFNPSQLLLVRTVAPREEPPVYWEQVAQRLREVPGVENAAICGWPLLDNNAWNGFVSVNGAPPSGELAYFLSVSPGWMDTMKAQMVDGRDFRPDEVSPGAAIVNETFVKTYFPGRSPLGQSITKTGEAPAKVVGVVRDTPYRNIREPVLPTAFVPFRRVDSKGILNGHRAEYFVVRTSGQNPMALAQILRREIPRARPEFRVSDVRTQAALVQDQSLRERLVAVLGVFFAVVALLIAGIGLYGVLDYSVVQRQREIGIRVAIGAPAANIARLVTREIFAMVLVGAAAGAALGLASAGYIEALLFQVKSTDPAMLALPAVTILGSALLAALPGIFHALHIDPVMMLRAE